MEEIEEVAFVGNELTGTMLELCLNLIHNTFVPLTPAQWRHPWRRVSAINPMKQPLFSGIDEFLRGVSCSYKYSTKLLLRKNVMNRLKFDR